MNRSRSSARRSFLSAGSRAARFGFGAMVAALLLTPALARPAAAEDCRSLRGVTDVCATQSTTFRQQDGVDSIRTLIPATRTDGLGAYFQIAPARSFEVAIDAAVREHVSGPWLEALARFTSVNARVDGDASPAAGLAPLSVRIANVVPRGGRVGSLTASAALPKSMPQRVRVIVAVHDSVVWRSDSHAAGAIAVLPDWPRRLRAAIAPMGGLEFSWRFEAASPIHLLHAGSANETVVTGDELRISGGFSPAASLNQVQIQAAGLDSLRVSDPEVAHGPPPLRPRRPRPVK